MCIFGLCFCAFLFFVLAVRSWMDESLRIGRPAMTTSLVVPALILGLQVARATPRTRWTGTRR
jgi:hypothetical protein